MKIMAVDYGDARTGLAVCDRTEFLSTPVGQIEEKSMAKVAEGESLFKRSDNWFIYASFLVESYANVLQS